MVGEEVWLRVVVGGRGGEGKIIMGEGRGGAAEVVDGMIGELERRGVRELLRGEAV
jgi:hypothetical protein